MRLFLFFLKLKNSFRCDFVVAILTILQFFKIYSCISALIQCMAKETSLTPILGLKRFIAFIKPIFPSWIKSVIGKPYPDNFRASFTTKRKWLHKRTTAAPATHHPHPTQRRARRTTARMPRVHTTPCCVPREDARCLLAEMPRHEAVQAHRRRRLPHGAALAACGAAHPMHPHDGTRKHLFYPPRAMLHIPQNTRHPTPANQLGDKPFFFDYIARDPPHGTAGAPAAFALYTFCSEV